MEISVVRQRLLEARETARRAAVNRRARRDEAQRAFDAWLADVAVPLAQQLAHVLRAEGLLFQVFTPSGSVRLMSERRAEDYVELLLDTSGDPPRVVGHSSQLRGSRLTESERVVGGGDPAALGEEDVLAFLLTELEPFLER